MEAHFTVSPEHPALPGHFPGNPVVPGVVILDEIVRLWLEAHPDVRLAGIPAAKFLSVLRPGETCRLRFDATGENSVKFECFSGDRRIAQGRLLFNLIAS
ncbi:acyl-CoA synthetase/AMP-acid ligase [Methylocaldum marinum]|uniref:Acyl-CoA synthetase/AMP-acid ligase n=1 Tax=Methylocaldum marinum TaxID=1432792 RepID=A0A250KTC1_9GAMM|nr:beta-hydroxyacyl-ACP dehydratase [Methylocaldum marinum]BBA34786.1 acyl-CoA synthetase/AMP-acid ligase [Methylocaldum marinum]